MSGRTYTIEANPEYYKKAMNRLKGDLEHIEVVLGDSTLEMKSILERYSNQTESILAYLDAHWYKNVPTRKELELLLNWGGKWIAIIDDFEIPSDSGYTFDKYEDQIVGIGMVPIGVDLEVWVSTVNSRNESGAKRGTGYVFSPGTRSQLSELALKDMVKIL